MSPGGHLLTTVAACTVAALTTESWALTAGVAAGGFLIDVDHAVDYVLFERQRDLRPSTFLRYYVEGRARRAVLGLHSYELFAVLGLLAWLTGSHWLQGYLLGGLMHLICDLLVNGELTPKSIVAFYSFSYRAAHRFDTATLLGSVSFRAAPASFWHSFFRGAQTAGAMLDFSRHARARRRG